VSELRLLGKELRQLLPWAGLNMTITLGSVLSRLLTKPPDQASWAADAPIFANGTAHESRLLIWSFVLAFASCAREHDDGTLTFLFSLPTRRSAIYLRKICAGMSLLLAGVALEASIDGLLSLANPSTFGQTFRLDWAALSAGISVCVAWIFYGHALLLSVLRRFGLLLGLVLYIAIGFATRDRPDLRVYNPFLLHELEFRGSTPRVPWAGLLGQLGVSSALAALAGWLWVGRGASVADAMAHLSQRPASKLLFALPFGLLAVSAGYFATLGQQSSESWPSAKNTVGAVKIQVTRLETRRYELRYPEPLRQVVERLAAPADDLHEALAAELGAPLRDERVAVDLTQTSPTHAGSATWESIRLDLSKRNDEADLLRVLAHETVHVLAQRASDRRISEHDLAFGFFNEGLAELLSLKHVPDEPYRQARWFEAALLHRRHRVEFADLVSFSTFERRFGLVAVYPLALVWVESFVETCGEGAARQLLANLALPDGPRAAHGLALWRHLLQLQGCDASRVNTLWSARLQQRAAELGDELDRVPELIGGVAALEAGELVLRAGLEGRPPEAARYALWLRSAAGAESAPYSLPGQLESDGVLRFRIPESFAVASTLHFQLLLSWQRAGEVVELRSEWKSTPLPER